MSGDAREAHQDAPGARGAVGRAEGAPRVVDAPQRAAPCDGEACPLPVRVGDVTLPGDLLGLLGGTHGVESLRTVGRIDVAEHLLRVGISDTRALLELDPARLQYQGIKDPVRIALGRYLARAWGVSLGALFQREPERASLPFRWADPNTWPGDLDVTKPWTWSDEVCAQPVPARYARFVPAEMWLQLRREVA